MADTRQKQQERNTSSQPVERSTADEQRPVKRDWDRPSFSPFSVMRRGLDEMERWFGTGMRSEWDQVRRGWMGNAVGDWSPAVEAFHRGNEFVIRADVPGMNRQDLQVEVGEDSVTVHGERKQDRQEEREGVFWTERSYGSFTRVIPLPPGAITDSAKATFNNGVLEVVMQAPSAETRRGRRLDISGADEGKK
jgi:HSP20 family protein